jgi:hypothetical protein
MTRTFILVTAAALAAAVAATAQPSLGKPFDLKVGESATVGPQNLAVGFDELLSDSRCPIGVFCFWEGDAAAQMWVKLPDETRGDFQLHTNHGFKWKFSYNYYEITLLRVSPYPVYEVPTFPGDYLVTVQVDGGPAPTKDSTWGRIKSLYGNSKENRR